MAEPRTCGDESAIRQGETDRMPTPRCLSVDLEVGKDGRIHALAAVRADTDQHLTHSRSGLTAALARLDDLADGADFLLGHNLIAFDLPHLKKHDLPKLEALPVVDTLRLSPLAFPRHPYHRLVKHYLDGGLKPDRVNDPLLDSLLTLELFRDECKALAETAKAEPDLVAAWHRLCTPDPANVDRALDEMFRQIRQDRRPSPAETTAAIKRMLKIGQGQAKACAAQAQEIMADSCRPGWPLAYALAWISEAGGNSVLPPWVRRRRWGASPSLSGRRPAAGVIQRKSLRSFAGIARIQMRNTTAASDAMPGRWSCRNSCSSRNFRKPEWKLLDKTHLMNRGEECTLGETASSLHASPPDTEDIAPRTEFCGGAWKLQSHETVEPRAALSACVAAARTLVRCLPSSRELQGYIISGC